MAASCEWSGRSARGLPETGPGSSDWWPEALLPQLQPKTGRLPGWVPRQPGCSLAAPTCHRPAPGLRATTCWLWLAGALPTAPIQPPSSPSASVCSSVSQAGQTLSDCLLQRRALDKCPHPLSGGTNRAPSPCSPGSAGLSPRSVLAPRGKEHTPQPDYSLIPTRVPGQSHLAVERCTDLDD